MVGQLCGSVFLCFSLLALLDVSDGLKGNSLETRVFVDKTAFNRWKLDLTLDTDSEKQRVSDTKRQMTTYIKSVFAGANAIFGQLKTSRIYLEARIVSIEFVTSQTISTSVYDGTKVNSDKVLSNFRSWLMKQTYPPVDHSLLMTGLDLSNGKHSHVHGVAVFSGMCSPNQSFSAVEVDRNGNTVLTLVHELGHSLGARHDGDDNKCGEDSLMIMDASRTQNSPLNFKFSKCSRKYIKKFLKYLDKSHQGNCLASTAAPRVQSKQLGELFDPDTICTMSLGPQASLARIFYGVGRLPYKKICTSIMCGPTSTGQTSYMSVGGTDGFVCGKGRRCSLGACVKSRSAPSKANKRCLFGDTPSYVAVHEGDSCEALRLKGESYHCYHSGLQACCKSCRTAKTKYADCRYGDKVKGCTALTGKDCYSNHEKCCSTCRKFQTSDEDCKYGDKASYCRDLTSQGCYQAHATCCARCKQFHTSIAGCEYGDKFKGCQSTPSFCSYYGEDECCKTCSAAKKSG